MQENRFFDAPNFCFAKSQGFFVLEESYVAYGAYAHRGAAVGKETVLFLCGCDALFVPADLQYITVAKPGCVFCGGYMKKIAVIMGSDSDLPVVEKAVQTLEEFGVPYTVHICSAHRTPAEASGFSASARENGYGVIIAAAGLAAHLAGALAANTILPVIGIPLAGGVGGGLDALLSTVMMPPGVPVATVGVGGAVNAALLAIQILAVSDAALAQKLQAYKVSAAEKVRRKDADIQNKYNIQQL